MTAPRSSFITVLAWLTLVAGVRGVVSGLLQASVATTMLPALLPDLDSSVASLLSGLTLVSLVFSLLSVWVGARLLQRRDWARLAMVVLLVIGVVLAAAGAVVCLGAMFVVDPRVLTQAGLPDELFPLFRSTLVVLGAGALAIVGVHVWLIARLRSAAIRAEFEK